MKRNEVMGWGERGTGTGDHMFTPEDDFLFDGISDYMKGCLDIEDVKSDPLYEVTLADTRESVAGFDRKDPDHAANAKYIRDSISGEHTDVDRITAGWIKEWKEKQKKSDPENIERRNFITASLNSLEVESGMIDGTAGRKQPVRTIMARFMLPVAALIVGALLIIKMLLPSHNADKIFKDFYAPMSTMTTVTRSTGNAFTNDYSSAIENYKNGDYKSASVLFSDILRNNPEFIPALFYMGISRIELGNYDDAIRNLSPIADVSSEYSADAAWYLGLAYLKKNDIVSAEKYFSKLAASKGFYSDRAGKILRLLK